MLYAYPCNVHARAHTHAHTHDVAIGVRMGFSGELAWMYVYTIASLETIIMYT